MKIKEYKPILAPPDERGYAALNVHPPGTFNNTDFRAFVGGCGVGGQDTLKAAEQLLLREAKAYCQRQIDKARKRLNHYQAELAHLNECGLEPKK